MPTYLYFSTPSCQHLLPHSPARQRFSSSLYRWLPTLSYSTLTATGDSPCPQISVLEHILLYFLLFLCRYHYRCTCRLAHRPIITHSHRIMITPYAKIDNVRIYWFLWHLLSWSTSHILPPIIRVAHIAGSGIHGAFLWWRLYIIKK